MMQRALCNFGRLRGSKVLAQRMVSSGRSFNVLGIQQIAIGGLDKQALSEFWVDTLGVTKVGT